MNESANLCKTAMKDQRQQNFCVTMEEEEDEDDVASRRKPKTTNNLLLERIPSEQIDQTNKENLTDQESNNQKNDSYKKESLHASKAKETRVRISKARSPKLGLSALGISVMSVRGKVGSTRNETVDLRLDSGADITLISEEFFSSLKDRPKVQQGMRMKLWQLTDDDCELKGFIRIPIFMYTSEGVCVETEAEAYIVPKMTVPILLGEDYQMNYEINVNRSLREGNSITFATSKWSIPCSPVNKTEDFRRLRSSAFLVASFRRNKIHRRNKAKRRRDKIRQTKEAFVVRATEDYCIEPQSCKNIRVNGPFGEDREWLLEREFMTNSKENFLVIPNVLLTSENPVIPISNVSYIPRYI